MRIPFFATCIIILNFVNSAVGQNTSHKSTTTVYSGGIDSLDKHIAKNIRNKITLLSDQLLFFKVTLSQKEDVSVEELYGVKNGISSVVKEAIHTTSRNWIKPKKGLSHIVIPIFFIAEKKDKNSNILTYSNFKFSRESISCILFPPIVYTHYSSTH